MILVSAAAILDDCHRVLIQQRPENDPHAFLWEFPGGKVETGEHPLEALKRECSEELGIEIETQQSQPIGFSFVDRLEKPPILILLYICERWSGVPTPHFAAAMRWAKLDELEMLDLVPADIVLLQQLKSSTSHTNRLGPT